ncbi:serine hydrolase domain-containing protein [Leucobacter denitrificans]|uniref:Beta-lactamase family protein n=1 Tax=Leucobacter denitrificans TaxID=683042 RepID=A0A7G9S7B4_9MICO|nr:serine hydrolase domain-containing protein [Leucobacter denitrificans]QNN63739.1 beta-lactamase family protein [Leucobacter denitrificans]
MGRFRLRVAAATSLIALLLAGCASVDPDAASTEPESRESTETLAADLEAAVGGLLGESGIPGAVFLATKDGKPQWSYVYNNEERQADPVEFDQVFAYRSITKSFVVTALLTLVDEGQVSLDDPIGDYVEGVPNGDRVTLRHLATMRSGLANYSAMPELGELLMDDPTVSVTDTELIAAALTAPFEFEPDAQYMYSNTNAVLLGMVIKEVTGEDWGDAVRSRILEPLGLDSVTYPADPASVPQVATPYQWLDDELEVLPAFSPTLFGAAGGLFGTVTDLATWADELGQGTLLDPATQKERLDSFGPTADDPLSPEYDEYGIGIGKIGDYVGHTGNGLGYQALAMHNIETEVSVAILINATTEDGDLPAHLFELLVPVLELTREL